MPQSQLPDLNTIWLKWTDNVNTCLIMKDYQGAIAGVYHINAIFSADNRIEINSDKYYQQTNERLKIVCSSCRAELVRNDVEVVDVLLSSIESMVIGQKTEKVWICTECEKVNSLEYTEFIKEQFENPRYLGVIPDPPIEVRGLMGRKNFGHDATHWVRIALDELSHALGIERREYVPMLDRTDVIDDETNN